MYDKSLGGLWLNQRRTHPKSPNYLGSLKLQPKELRVLLEIAENEGEAKINLAGWKNQKGSETFVTLEAQAPLRPGRPVRETFETNSLERFAIDEEEDFI